MWSQFLTMDYKYASLIQSEIVSIIFSRPVPYMKITERFLTFYEQMRIAKHI